jgi:guanylate kinase
MERVPMELDQARLFDHQVVNDVLSKAADEVDAIVKQHIQQS